MQPNGVTSKPLPLKLVNVQASTWWRRPLLEMLYGVNPATCTCSRRIPWQGYCGVQLNRATARGHIRLFPQISCGTCSAS